MIITQTPLRISLLGGGTDFRDFYKKEDGLVVSAAIDKYIFIIVKERYDDLIYVNYSKKEIKENVLALEHELVRECLVKTGIDKGIEISILADIPSEGSGLGSSSSVTVGLLNAFYTYKGEQVTAERLAAEACDIEINKCGQPIGKQDQYVAAYGGLCSYRFKGTGNVEVKKLETGNSHSRLLGSNLLLFFTGITRQASSILSEQKNNISIKMEELHQIKILAEKGCEAINNYNFDEVCYLMHQNWQLKKSLSSNIANPEIDDMYNEAMNAGALGGKIAGAGGGGFLMVYCRREEQNNVREALNKYKEMPFLLERDGSKAIFNYRRYSWK